MDCAAFTGTQEECRWRLSDVILARMVSRTLRTWTCSRPTWRGQSSRPPAVSPSRVRPTAVSVIGTMRRAASTLFSSPVEHHTGWQYYPAFQRLIDAAEVTRVPLPPRSPNLNAYAERWVRSVKEDWTERRCSKPDQPRQQRYSLGRGCVIRGAGRGWGPASRVRRADGSGAGRPTQGLVERRNPSSNSVTFSACACCTQCPAPSSRWTPVIRVQAVPFILSTAPGRW